MSLGQLVFGLLSAHAPLTALVEDRIYPLVAPQGVEAPRVVYQVIDDTGIASFDGVTGGLYNARLQVDAYAKDYDAAQDVADAVGTVLKSFVTVEMSSLQVARRDLYEDTTGMNRVSMDFKVWRQGVTP